MANFGSFGSSQFGGGGFVKTKEIKNERPASAGQRSGESEKSLRAITLRYILKSAGDEPLMVDGKEVSGVTVVGRITAMQQKESCTYYTVNDGTSEMKVAQFRNGNENQENLADLVVGRYIRLYGTMRTLDGQPCIYSHAMRPITDFNEVTHHNLQCVLQHLYFTKGPLPSEMPSGGNSMHGLSGIRGSMLGDTGGFGSNTGVGYGHLPTSTAMSPLAEDIKMLFMQSGAPDTTSIHISDIVRTLQNKYGQNDIRQTVNKLVDDGMMYSGSSDDVFQWLSS